MIIPMKFRILMHTQEFCVKTLDKCSPFMHTEYVSTQLLFVNTMKFVLMYLRKVCSIYTSIWNKLSDHLSNSSNLCLYRNRINQYHPQMK